MADLEQRLQPIFVNERGRVLDSSEPDYNAALKAVNNYRKCKSDQHEAFLAQHEIDSTESIDEALEAATKFTDSMGLYSSASVHIIDSEGLAKQPTDCQASYQATTNSIYLFAQSALAMSERFGANVLGATFVHERIHSSRSGILGLTKYPDGVTKWLSRDGFNVIGYNGHREGQFYEEAFAEYCAGLFIRRSLDPACSLISDPSQLKNTGTVPAHYYDTGENVAGPDGYTVELLAYGVEQKGIMAADEFIGAMFRSRHTDLQAEGLRTFARAIDALQPGLYTELRGLQYSRDAWLGALATVQTIVAKYIP